MRDLESILRESVDAAYDRSARDDGTTQVDVKRSVLRRGRRRRAARIAAASVACIGVLVAAPVATQTLRDRETQVAGPALPELRAELVWETGGPLTGDEESIWFGGGLVEDDPGDRNNVARLDAATGEIVDGPVAVTYPHALALGESGLWSVSWQGDLPADGEGTGAAGVVERVDPHTLERTATLDWSASAPQDVVVGEKAGAEVVWVVDAGQNALLEIDPGSAQVAAVRQTATRPTAVYTSGSYVYVASSEDRVVERFDAAAGDVARFDVPGCANDIVTAAGSLWVADACGGAVHRLDETSGEIVATIEVERPSVLAFADGLVWVGAGDRVLRIDPDADAIAGDAVRLPDPIVEGMHYASGSIWVSTSEAVYRLVEEGPRPPATPPPDRRAAELPDGVSRISVPDDPQALVGGAGSLWTGLRTIDRIDPVSGGLLTQIETPGRVEDLAYDEGAGLVWGLVDVEDQASRVVVAVDPATNEITFGPVEVATIPAPGEEIAAHGGIAWVPGPDGKLNRIDLGRRAVTQVELGDHFTGRNDSDMHVAATRFGVFVVGTNGVVVRVDPSTGDAERTDDLGEYVYGVAAGNDVLWNVQQTRAGVTYLWPLDARTGRAGDRRRVEEARGFPHVAEHDGTVWLAQPGPGGTGITVTAFVAGERPGIFGLPEGTTMSDLAAGPEGAWLDGGEGVLYRIDPG